MRVWAKIENERRCAFFLAAQRNEASGKIAFCYDETVSGASVYNVYRDYSPDTGRYIEADPLGIVTTGAPTTTTGLNHLYAYVGSSPLSRIDPLGLDPWDWNGIGNTSVCEYYDDQARTTGCSYYKSAASICRGQRRDVNTLLRLGIAQAWLSGRTTQSEAQITSQIRQSLISYNRIAKALGPTEACGCPKGNSIDLYHNLAFGEAGVSPFFYGGNLLPQGLLGNPFPYDPTGNSSFDPRRLFH